MFRHHQKSKTQPLQVTGAETDDCWGVARQANGRENGRMEVLATISLLCQAQSCNSGLRLCHSVRECARGRKVCVITGTMPADDLMLRAAVLVQKRFLQA